MGEHVPTSALEVTDRMGAVAAQSGGGPRVSLKDIEDNIAYVFYVSGADAIKGGTGESRGGLSFRPSVISLEVMTICIVQMKNGFNVIGQSTPASPENFDPIVGKQNAYENAIRQLWPLMAFALLDRGGGRAR